MIASLIKKRGGSTETATGVSPIAVDFGVGAMRIVQVAGGSERRLIASAELETPEQLVHDTPGRLDHQARMLPSILKKSGARGKRVACSLPSSQTFCKHLQINKATEAEERHLVSSAIAESLGARANDLVVRHECVDGAGRGSKQEVIGFATSRPLVQRVIGAIKAAKLVPAAVHSELHALAAAAPYLNNTADKPALLIDLSPHRTNVIIVDSGRMVFARTVECGTRRSGEDLVDEISMCVRYHGSILPDRPVAEAVFLGGDENSCEAIGRRLRVPSVMADPIAAVANAPAAGPGWAVAAGLCLAATDL